MSDGCFPKIGKPAATVIAGLFPWEERLLLQPVNQLFPGKSALLENPEKRSFRKDVVERDNGSVGPLLEADVAALLSNYLKTFFFEEGYKFRPGKSGEFTHQKRPRADRE